MQWRVVRAMWWWELRSALRERSIVVNSVLVPLLLYPAVLWLTMLGLDFASGQTESFVTRVALCALPSTQTALALRLETTAHLRLRTDCGDRSLTTAEVREGSLDAALWFTPIHLAGAGPDSYQVELDYDSSRDRSVEARQRLRGILDAQRTRWIDHLVAARGHQDPGQGFEVVLRNVASGRDMGAFLAGLLIPLMLVVMVAVGCQTPAVDATAGERERGTWETLMTSAATRTDLVVGKYLAVATLGIQAGLLNLGAMLLTMRGLFGPALGSEGSQVEVQVPLRALPVLLAGTLAVALLVAAGSMLLAAFARSFKDGQAMTQPFLVVVVLGVTLVQQPDTQLTTTFALVPVAGVMLAMREALAGQLPVLPLVLCALSQAVAIAACLGLAALVLRAEDVVIGSYDGSLWTFLRARWRRPNRRDA